MNYIYSRNLEPQHILTQAKNESRGVEYTLIYSNAVSYYAILKHTMMYFNIPEPPKPVTKEYTLNHIRDPMTI